MVIDERHRRRQSPQQMNLHPSRQLQQLEERYLLSQRRLKSRYISTCESQDLDFAADRRRQQIDHERQRANVAREHNNRRQRLRDEHTYELYRINEDYRGSYRRRKERHERRRYADECHVHESNFQNSKYQLDVWQKTEIVSMMQSHRVAELESLESHQQAVADLRDEMFWERNGLIASWLRSWPG